MTALLICLGVVYFVDLCFVILITGDLHSRSPDNNRAARGALEDLRCPAVLPARTTVPAAVTVLSTLLWWCWLPWMTLGSLALKLAKPMKENP